MPVPFVTFQYRTCVTECQRHVLCMKSGLTALAQRTPGLKWGRSRQIQRWTPSWLILSYSRRSIYSSPTRRWVVVGIREMRMRKISWRLIGCYYPSWKHSHSELTAGYPKSLMCAFCVCWQKCVSLAPTTVLYTHPPQYSTAPHCTEHAQPPSLAGIIS